MLKLAGVFQDSVERRLGAQELPLISQAGHDLARREMAKLIRVGNRQNSLTLERGELILGRLYS